DSEAGDALAASDPSHSLVGLPLHTHRRGLDTEHAGKAGTHCITIRRDAGRLGDDGDVHLGDAITHVLGTSDSNAEHLQRVAPSIGGVAIGKELADVPRPDCTENGVGDGVGDGVTVGVANEMPIEGDVDASELEWAAVGEAM